MKIFLFIIAISACLCDIDVSGLNSKYDGGYVDIKGLIKVTKPINKYMNTKIKLACVITENHASQQDFLYSKLYLITKREWEEEAISHSVSLTTKGNYYTCSLAEVDESNRIYYLHGVSEVLIKRSQSKDGESKNGDSWLCSVAKQFNSNTNSWISTLCGDSCKCHISTATVNGLMIAKSIYSSVSSNNDEDNKQRVSY